MERVDEDDSSSSRQVIVVEAPAYYLSKVFLLKILKHFNVGVWIVIVVTIAHNVSSEPLSSAVMIGVIFGNEQNMISRILLCSFN